MASDVSLGGTHLVAWLILRATCGYCPCLCVHTLVGPCLTDSLCCTCSYGVPQPGQHLLAQAAPHRSHLCGAWSGGRQAGLPGRATPNVHGRDLGPVCGTPAWVTSGAGLHRSAWPWVRSREVEVGSY